MLILEDQRKINENSTQFSVENLDVESHGVVKKMIFVTRVKHVFVLAQISGKKTSKYRSQTHFLSHFDKKSPRASERVKT